MAFSTEMGALGVSHSVSLLFASDQADEIAAAINKLILLNGGGSTPKWIQLPKFIIKYTVTKIYYYTFIALPL